MDNLTLIDLWTVWADTSVNNVVILENYNKEIVGSIYLNKWKNYKVTPVINELNSGKEKYYLFLPDLGLGIFFSYFKRFENE